MHLIFISTLIKRSVLGLNINSVTNELYNNTGIKNSKYVEEYLEKSKKTGSKDTLEISSEAYAAQLESKEISATSGKDTLGITSGSDNNTFVIHFYDSAMVSRAISRGYITVNGTRIDLSDETKQQLAEVDKQAEADRMRAFNEYVMQHDLAVAKQQSESWQKAYKDASKAIEIAAKISRGGKVTNEEAKILMNFNPQMYALAMSSASSTKQNNHQESMQQTEIKEKDESTSGVEWSQFDWKTYESQMTVSIGKSVDIQGISEGENNINEETN